MERAVQIFAVVQMLIIGLSHIVRPRVWSEFFLLLRSKGAAGGFVNGFLSLVFGSIIVAFHPVWSGIPLILTILGWAQVLKSFLIFVVPGYAEKSLEKAPIDRPRVFIFPGILFLLLAGLLLYHLIAG